MVLIVTISMTAFPFEPPLLFDVTEEEPALFVTRVDRALEYIAAGDIYQANLSRGWRAHHSRPIDPVAVYRRLRAANPGPFSALMRCEDFAVMSSSPENLLSIRFLSRTGVL